MAAEDYEGQWPTPKFHFEVDIDGSVVSFQEVSGLEYETQVIEYRHGDDEIFFPKKMAGLMKTSNLVCKKGYFEDDEECLELFKAITDDKEYYTQDDRFDITVSLLNEQGDTVCMWDLTNCFPIKYSGTDLKSDANEVAIETIEFAYEEIEIEFEG